MATATLETPPIYEDYDRHIRFHDDETTWFAEILEGSMRTAPEYRFDGHELYARDGARVGDIFEGSIEAAKAMVARNPSMAFELRRRRIEHDEYRDMLAMARGELPNTMVVVSDFPP